MSIQDTPSHSTSIVDQLLQLEQLATNVGLSSHEVDRVTTFFMVHPDQIGIVLRYSNNSAKLKRFLLVFLEANGMSYSKPMYIAHTM